LTTTKLLRPGRPGPWPRRLGPTDRVWSPDPSPAAFRALHSRRRRRHAARPCTCRPCADRRAPARPDGLSRPPRGRVPPLASPAGRYWLPAVNSSSPMAPLAAYVKRMKAKVQDDLIYDFAIERK
jgi:hypothetical protein